MTSSLEESGGKRTRKGKKQRAIICYLCQKEFNMKKIQGHVDGCKKNFDQAQEKLKPEKR